VSSSLYYRGKTGRCEDSSNGKELNGNRGDGTGDLREGASESEEIEASVDIVIRIR